MSAITAEQIARVRALAGVTETEFGDMAVEAVIAEYPRHDASGRDPSDADWMETYDLFRAAADIVDQRASAVATEYDFQADGASVSRSQKQAQLHKLATRLRARSAPRWYRPCMEAEQ